MTRPFSQATPRPEKRPRAVVILVAALALFIGGLIPAHAAEASQARVDAAKPTVVLVHGAWADASSWRGEVARLQDDGYQVVALANPLRSLSSDAAYVRTFLETVTGPIVLVAHSYGGAVISNAATGDPDVKALVFVNAFMPDEGENATSLAGPDSALSVPDPTTVFDFVPATLPPSPSTDLYLKRSTVFNSFAQGLNDDEKAVVAASQRPVTLDALNQPSGKPAWRTIPSWALIGTEDQIIPPSVQRAMAARAGAVTTEYQAGHLGLMTDPATVTKVIERAAKATAH